MGITIFIILIATINIITMFGIYRIGFILGRRSIIDQINQERQAQYLQAIASPNVVGGNFKRKEGKQK